MGTNQLLEPSGRGHVRNPSDVEQGQQCLWRWSIPNANWISNRGRWCFDLCSKQPRTCHFLEILLLIPNYHEKTPEWKSIEIHGACTTTIKVYLTFLHMQFGATNPKEFPWHVDTG